MKLIRLQEQYKNYKKEFYKTAKHPHPSELLALLLLPEKDNFQPVSGNSREFYEYYEEEIKEKIDQVIVDFAITKSEIVNYIEQTIGNQEQDYEKNRIWSVFAHGFVALQWGIMYHPEWSPERIHNALLGYWGKHIPEHLIEEPIKRIKPKRKIKKISVTTTGFRF